MRPGTHQGRCRRKAARRSAISTGWAAWNAGANRRRIAVSAICGQALLARRPSHAAKRLPAWFGETSAAICKHEAVEQVGVTQGTVQQHEAAVAVAEPGRGTAAGRLMHRLGHPVGDSFKATLRGAGTGRSQAVRERGSGNSAPSAGTTASKLAASASSECSSTRGGPSPEAVIATRPSANISCIETSRTAWSRGFDPLSHSCRNDRNPVDVIFHEWQHHARRKGFSCCFVTTSMRRSAPISCSASCAPGADMREQELAQRYAVSRQPVREALLRLERERLVTVHAAPGISGQRDFCDGRAGSAAHAPRTGAGLRRGGCRQCTRGGARRRSTPSGVIRSKAPISSPRTAPSTSRWPRRRATGAWPRPCAISSSRPTGWSASASMGIRGRDPAQLVAEHAAHHRRAPAPRRPRRAASRARARRPGGATHPDRAGAQRHRPLSAGDRPPVRSKR